MADAGIDTDIFKLQSTHSASAAWIGKTLKLSVAQICNTASWSAKSTTFWKFYYILLHVFYIQVTGKSYPQ